MEIVQGSPLFYSPPSSFSLCSFSFSLFFLPNAKTVIVIYCYAQSPSEEQKMKSSLKEREKRAPRGLTFSLSSAAYQQSDSEFPVLKFGIKAVAYVSRGYYRDYIRGWVKKCIFNYQDFLKWNRMNTRSQIPPWKVQENQARTQLLTVY